MWLLKERQAVHHARRQDMFSRELKTNLIEILVVVYNVQSQINPESVGFIHKQMFFHKTTWLCHAVSS